MQLRDIQNVYWFDVKTLLLCRYWIFKRTFFPFFATCDIIIVTLALRLSVCRGAAVLVVFVHLS